MSPASPTQKHLPHPPRVPRRSGGVLDLVDYACLGDGRSVAISGLDGGIDWWAVDGIDKPPLFDRLLGGRGHFSAQPTEPFTVTRRYRPDSNVLETVFVTRHARARLTESLNSGLAGRLPWSELARRFDGLEGTMRFRVVMEASASARKGLKLKRVADDLLFSGPQLNLAVRAHPSVSLHIRKLGVVGEFAVSANERTVIALLGNQTAPVALTSIAAIDARIDESDSQWRRWANKLTYDGLYSAEVRRSALALKLLLYSPSGAIAAAATTSLPERIGRDKNWDYRFAWTRDVAYSIKALLRVGAYEEAQAALAWLYRAVERHGPEVRVFYGLDGEPGAKEKPLSLPGYRGSRPVRSGNDALAQRQLGSYGDLLIAARDFVAKGHQLGSAAIELLTGVANRAATSWRKKDSGIWELPREAHYTQSKMSCWTALDVAITLAGDGVLTHGSLRSWRTERTAIHRYIESRCWSETLQAYVMEPGSSKLDAAVLLGAPFGYPQLHRLDATRAAVQAELGRGPLLYRYSGMDEEEGCFLACSFWCVEALAICGHADASRELMDATLRATASDHGVYAEMVDPRSGAVLGNFPQGLSHLAMIHAAEAVSKTFRLPM